MNLTGGIGGFLDQLLTQGKDLARTGEDAAADRLGYGDSEAERGRLRQTAMVSAGAAGTLGLLLGSGAGRKLAGKAVMLGGLGLLGKVAFDAWQGRTATGGEAARQAPSVADLSGPEAETRALAITRALIAAAKADGHIDADERRRIDHALAQLSPAVRGLISEELDRPLDAAAVARLADSDQAGREIYLASLIVTGADTPQETAYLAELSRELRLDPQTVARLHTQVRG
jgi:uncharacterized membrane protein YebE (DUF533 family)